MFYVKGTWQKSISQHCNTFMANIIYVCWVYIHFFRVRDIKRSIAVTVLENSDNKNLMEDIITCLKWLTFNSLRVHASAQ